MHPPISEPDLTTILNEADAAAARLWRRLGLRPADLDDLRQDLLLDLIRRLPAFDARRGSIGAFAGLVLRNQASRLAIRIRRERRECGGPLLSLDGPDRDGLTIGNRLGEAEGLTAWHGGWIAVPDIVERQIALARALGALAHWDLRLCAAMAHCSVRGIAERRLGWRATLYQRIRELRCVLTAHGARPA